MFNVQSVSEQYAIQSYLGYIWVLLFKLCAETICHQNICGLFYEIIAIEFIFEESRLYSPFRETNPLCPRLKNDSLCPSLIINLHKL